VHEVAESGPDALAHLVLAAAGLPEVGDGAELGVDGSAAEPAVVEVLDGSLGVLLAPELDVDVADQMVAQVVANVHLLHLSVLLLGLDETVLEKVVVVLLHLFVADVSQVRAVGRLGRVLRVDVQVLHDDGLAETGLVVNP